MLNGKQTSNYNNRQSKIKIFGNLAFLQFSQENIKNIKERELEKEYVKANKLIISAILESQKKSAM